MGRALAGGGAIAVVLGLVLVALLDGSEEAPVAETQTIETDQLSQEELTGVTATLTLIESGRPLPYEPDGSPFQNRAGRWPAQPTGYYREYTVETPGSDDRGARRLVIGEEGEIFYTRDHYESFVRIESDAAVGAGVP